MKARAEYLRAGEIARLTGVSVRTVRRWIAMEILPSVKLGGSRLVARKDLERLLASPARDWTETEEERGQNQQISEVSG